MNNTLSNYFSGIGAKRLSEVEIKPDISNQHEFNGIKDFCDLFGTDKIKFKSKFIFLADKEEEVMEEEGNLTWYDAREKHPVRTEYRLYYSHNDVIERAVAGDLVIIARIGEKELAVIIAKAGSTSEKQLLWLFGLEEVESKFIVKDFSGEKKDIGFAGRYIISSLGLEIEETAPDYLEALLAKFGEKFPSTKLFSEFSRSTVKDISPVENPDETLMAWLEREELLFKTLESVIVKEKLSNGFGKDGTDVEAFIKFSLSVQNRRKSRAGLSFENNLAFLFGLNNINYSHGAITERNNRPDFIFPGIKQYHDSMFDTHLLTMLGLKTTAKDRWRQVLSEAVRIPNKHLITLEPAISKNQTEEMKANNLQLVIPKPLFATFNIDQQKELITLKDFIKYVLDKQSKVVL